MTRMSILIHNYARPAMPLLKAAGMSAMRLYVAAEMPFYTVAPSLQPPAHTGCLDDELRSSHESSGPIGIALAWGSKASALFPGPRHINPPKQLTEVGLTRGARTWP